MRVTRQVSECFELSEDNTLGATAWYKAQPQAVRAGIGLMDTAGSMKMGVVFENILQRGMLEFAASLPNGAPEFRYAYHEVIEEGHHSLMFQEFINRSGFDPGGLKGFEARAARSVVSLGRRFPELFLVFVLGGEEPIDYVQKQDLKRDGKQHPILRRIMQIHVTEEARHLCFAREYLQRNVPKLPWIKKARLAVMAPFILSSMARMMLVPSSALIKRYGIPKDVIREAYTKNPKHKAFVRETLQTVKDLIVQFRILDWRTAWLWTLLGLGNPLKPAPALPAEV